MLYFHNRHILAFFTTLLLVSATSHGQNISNWPLLIPGHEQEFTQKSGFTPICISDAYIDSNGKLWLSTCPTEKQLFKLPLVQLDGYQFTPANTDALKVSEPGWLKFIESGKKDHLMGYHGQDSSRTFFSFDLNTNHAELFPFDEFIPKIGNTKNIYQLRSGEWLYLYRTNDYFWIYKKEGKRLALQVKIPHHDHGKGRTEYYPSPLLQHGNEIWFVDAELPVFRWNQLTGDWKIFDRPDFPVHLELYDSYKDAYWQMPSATMVRHQSTILLCLPGYTKNNFYKWDAEADQFVPVLGFPEHWHAEALFQDKSGNVVYYFKNLETQKAEAILEDSLGQRLYFTKVVEGKRGINKLVGHNFKQELLICARTGLYITRVRQPSLIQNYLLNESIRGVAQFAKDKYLVSVPGDGWRIIDVQAGTSDPPRIDTNIEHPFGPLLRRTVLSLADNEIWTYQDSLIFHYNLDEHTAQIYNGKGNIHSFAFLNRDTIIYWNDHDHTIDFLNLKTGKISTYHENGQPKVIPGFVQEIKLSQDNQVFLPTNNGLWKIDFKNQSSQLIGHEPGFKDFRFITVYEEKNGRLWIGTFTAGLHIYDQETREVIVLDKSKGLANNTVASILPDEDGDLWVATYNGVSLVSPKGEVITNIGMPDGLSNREFNRYAYAKGRDGKLLLGTIRGLNIIDAKPFKERLSNKAPQIYLTEASFFDPAKKVDFSYQAQQKVPRLIQLAADKRYLKLQFALSSYIHPEKNQYAYQIEGIDKDWNYLGPQRELSLTNLPPGKYDLLIKGANFQGVWSQEPIRLSIHAKEFFYKEAWFYAVILSFASLIVFFWVRRLKFEKTRLEREVDNRTQQIRKDKDLIERQADELRQVDEVKSRFFTNISHELRTPITLITTPIENMLKKDAATLSQAQNATLRTVHNNGRKLLSLVEELLELSRLDANKQSLNPTHTPVVAFLKQLFSAYESKAQINRIDYAFHSDLEEDTWILVDKKHLTKIINNLLSNALKFTPNGGAVVFAINTRRVSETRRVLIAKVEDTGRGIPPEDLLHVFDRYFQTKRKSIATEGGTGIGLALARELAHLLGGNLTVQSEWGKGSTFTLELPFTEVTDLKVPDEPIEPVQPVVPPPLAKVPAAGNNIGTDKQKILIAEDNTDMQTLILSLLNEPHECIMANNGTEAWRLLEQDDSSVQDIALIISDIMMPHMDGYQLLERIKGHNKWQHLPVIMLTARAAEEDKLQALRMGVDDYLLKPFSSDELLARVSNLIRNYHQRLAFQQNEQEPVTFSFEKTPAANEVWLKDIEICIKEAIEKKMDLTSEYLADQMALSDRQLRRKLKSLTGLSTSQYIQEIRLQKARHLFERRAFNSISEVAYAVGFNTPGYLTKIFTKRFGKHPRAFLD